MSAKVNRVKCTGCSQCIEDCPCGCGKKYKKRGGKE